MSHKCEHATNFPSRTVRDTYDLVLLIARNPWFVESKDFSVGQSKVLGHLLNTSLQLFEMDHNHYQSGGAAGQSHVHIGRTIASGSGSVSYHMENTVITGAYSATQRNLEFRPVEHSRLGTRLEGPHFQAPIMGSSYDSPQHFQVVGNSYLATGSNSGSGYTSHYNEHCIHDVGSVSTIRASDPDRVHKRKVPRSLVTGDTGTTSTSYTAGSSSSLPESLLEKPTPAYQNYRNTVSLPHHHSNGLTICDESSQRNVRSRSRLALEAAPRRNYQPIISSYQYHPTTSFTNNSGGISNFGNERTARSHEQNYIPLSATPGRFSSSESNRMSHEMNQLLIGGGPTESGDSCHNPTWTRSFALPQQYHHRFQTHRRREDHNNHPYSRRSIPPRRAGLSLPHISRETISSQNSLHYHPERHLSRYARPSSAGGGHHNFRDGRSRLSTEGYEAFTMVGQSSFYGSIDLFDQYRDMRLDVDDMTYEELLALGERIGKVNTGLSVDMISKCLTEKTCFLSDDNLDQEICAICLEEYKSQVQVGTLKSCGHDYHVGCITDWLLTKNACPICKAPAQLDSLQGQ